jgi:hypothetical protein
LRIPVKIPIRVATAVRNVELASKSDSERRVTPKTSGCD